MTYLRKSNISFILATVLAISAISAALAFQHLGGLVPCHLCLQERVPYYVMIPMMVLSCLLMAVRKNVAILSILLLTLISIVVIAYGIDTSIYHAGAEWGFWDGPATCSQSASTPKTLDDYIAQINAQQVVDCTKPAFVFLGLSLAGWNIVASVLIIVLLGISAKFRADHIYKELSVADQLFLARFRRKVR